MNKTKTYLFLLTLASLFAACAGSYKVTNIERTRIIVDSTYDATPDAKAVAFLEMYQAKVDSIMSPVVGHTAKGLVADRPESPLSNLLSDHTQIPKEIRNMNYHQLSLFDDYHMQEPLPTQQKGGL